MKATSARTNGLCGVLYPGNYSATQATVKNRSSVTLHALDAQGKRIDGNKIVKINENIFEYELGGLVYKSSPFRL